MGKDDPNETTRGGKKANTSEEARRAKKSMREAHDRDACVEERIRRLERKAQESDR